jgi:hypothetical protein
MRVCIAHAVLSVCLIFALACFFERPAYAYIDPGSGILACQALSAFFAGVFFYFRRGVRNLIRSFHVPGAGNHSPVEISRTDR